MPPGRKWMEKLQLKVRLELQHRELGLENPRGLHLIAGKGLLPEWRRRGAWKRQWKRLEGGMGVLLAGRERVKFQVLGKCSQIHLQQNHQLAIVALAKPPS